MPSSSLQRKDLSLSLSRATGQIDRNQVSTHHLSSKKTSVSSPLSLRGSTSFQKGGFQTSRLNDISSSLVSLVSSLRASSVSSLRASPVKLGNYHSLSPVSSSVKLSSYKHSSSSGIRNGSFVIRNGTGFTLVELMIVIAIIGVLAASLFPMISNYMYKAKKTAMIADTKQITTVLQVVMAEQGKALKDITGFNCTTCYCSPGQPLAGAFSGNVKTVESGELCYDKTTAMWEKLKAITGFGFKVPYRDPWGGIYMIEENFLETPANPCVHDTLYSAGPSNIREYIWLSNNTPVGEITEIGIHGNLGVHLEFPSACQNP